MKPAFVNATPVCFRQASPLTSVSPLAVRQRFSPIRSCRTRRNISWKMATAPPTAEVTWPSAEEVSAGKTLVKGSPLMTAEDVMRILPHRYPFLLLDRVIAFEPGKRAMGIKAVTINEPFFPGHFPNRPIMPGVLQVEALAQLGGVVMLQPPFIKGDPTGIDFFFGGVDKVKWRRPVVPGDTLVMEMKLVSFRESFGIAKMEGRTFVDGQLAVEGQFTLVMVKEKK